MPLVAAVILQNVTGNYMRNLFGKVMDEIEVDKFEGLDVLRRVGQARQGNVAGAVLGSVLDRIRSVAMPITRLPMPSIAIHAGHV